MVTKIVDKINKRIIFVLEKWYMDFFIYYALRVSKILQ